MGLPLVAILVGGGGAALADALHVDTLSVVAIAGGLAVFVAAIFRPWPFWDHPAALTVRAIVGNRGAVVFYLLVGIGLVAWGTSGIRDWARNAAACRNLYEAAHTPQEREGVLRRAPPGVASHLTCDRYRDFGKY